MNTRSRIASCIAAGSLLLAAGPGRADDTDIYVSGTSPVGSEPMVMFSLDYRPNLGSTACGGDSCDYLIAEGLLPATGPYTFFDVLRAVLKRVMEPIEGVKVGLMINHDHKNGCENSVTSGCSNGGYIARGFELYEADDGNGAKDEFHDILAAIPTPGGTSSHSYQGKELFFEFYRYLSGQGVYNGHVGFRDFSSATTTNLDVDGPGYDWDTSIENVAGTTYLTPIEPLAACAKIFTVNFMFQVSNQEADSDTALRQSVAAGGMGFPSGTITFPQVIQWLNSADIADGAKGTAPNLIGNQNVTSYFIVDPTKINTTTTGYAQAGGTGVPLPLDTDPAALESTLTDIFKQILSVSTTFVAASIPVNVFNRAEVVDNVFLSLFQPDADGKPGWNGNVKKLRIAGLTTTTPYLIDSLNQPAVAPDGRLRFDALTHWTDAASLPAPDTSEGEVAGRDGRAVPRGAAGQKIPGFVGTGPGSTNLSIGGRRLFYDTPLGTLGNLNADLVTAPLLRDDFGVATDAESLAMLQFVRGRDVDDLDGDGNVTEARRWIFGDPLHSRPLPINYGARAGYTETNPAIFVAVSSNDGFLRMIRNTTTGGAESGAEVWAFMPRSVMSKVPTLRTNAAGTSHPYLIDSSPTAFLHDANNNGTLDTGEEAFLFAGLRRGGEAYYALDISSPVSPGFEWRIDSDDSDFAELGMTFSEPRIIRYLDDDGDLQVGLIFAGGYDSNKDADALGTDDDEGNAIFVVDAESGELVWKAVQGSGSPDSDTFYHEDLTDSIPSAVSVLDSDGDGSHDRAYVGDTGGKVWRVDMAGNAGSEGWKLTLLANLGRHVTNSKPADRRFTARPDIVLSTDAQGAFDGVLIGTGDREDPLDKGGVTENWFFLIKDRYTKPGTGEESALTIDDLGDVTDTCIEPDSDCTADLVNGWAMQLESSGEKALSTPTTVANTVYFTTYLPPGSSDVTETCGPSEGSGRLYAVSLFDGSARRNYDTTTDELERYTDLKSAGIPAEVVSLPPNSILRPDLNVEPTGAPTRFETYWYEAEDADL
jgi:type IV pilus assembly protein PilY1